MNLSVLVLFFILFAGFLNEAQALSQPRSCTWEHLTQAVRLNEARRPMYAYLTHNRSLPLSNALISMENEMLKKAVLSDLVTFVFQVQGIPLLCKEYVSMDLVPDFKMQAPPPWPLLQTFKSLDLKKLTTALNGANERENFSAVLETAKEWLDLLRTEPQFHCLTRHFIESIGRTAALAPEQEALSRQVGLSSLKISQLFIRQQISTLAHAQELDRQAAPFQAAGVPIICQDVPPIDILNSY